MKFNELFINDRIKKALVDLNYITLTEVQEQSMPIIFEENDILVKAKTGSGKTASFMLPIINNILKEKERFVIRGLIIVPTRELAMQIHDATLSYCKYTNIRSLALIGGVKDTYHKQKINQGVDLLIATPGRLLDLINQKVLNFKSLNYLVIDEADKMLDMGFIKDIENIISVLPRRQTLMFSATIPEQIKQLSNNILNFPEEVFLKEEDINVTQEYYLINQVDKLYLLKDIIRKQNMKSVLVFCRTKLAAEKTSNFLRGNNVTSDFINKDRSQIERQKALNKFKDNKIQALVATDIASRGIDVEDLSNVINFDLPNDLETYIHRIGRTARKGKNGVVTTFCSKQEVVILEKIKEKYDLKKLSHRYKEED
ncbi:MAG: DEAD/DEAH box helicase [bacterium]